MTEISHRIQKKFLPFEETSIAPLIVFRIIFGALMLFGSIRFISKGWVDALYIQPDFHFTYLGFDWVQPLPESWMYLPFVLMIVTSILIIFGCFYRVAAILFFLCFTYVELIDKTYYLNHYYFVSLVAFLMMLLPAHRYFSIDALIFPTIKRTTTARWHIGILKFQLVVVYFFAGLAKLNSDWLFSAQPLRTWLQAHHHLPLIGDLFQTKWLPFAFSWFGCIYDLFIPFLLLSVRFRRVAYFFVVVFHLVTWLLFPIGVFPWVMIFMTLIFFSSSFHERILHAISRIGNHSLTFSHSENSTTKTPSFTRYFIVIYVLIQLLVPLRFMLYKGDLFWNEEGFRFSWRVMLMHKEGHATFYVRDAETGRESEINNAKFLTRSQEDQMATQPDMILQYAQHLKSYYDGKKLHYGDHKFVLKNPTIHAKIYVSLNGRRSQLFVDKKHDLSSLSYNLYHRTWIEPFKQ